MIKAKTKMEIKKIRCKTALELIKENKSLDNVVIDFCGEKILWKDAMILGKKGIEIPQEYIDYDDENIDYSDIPPVTDDDIVNGKIKWTINAELSLEKEIADWIKNENININEFATKLIRNFYNGLKYLPKNTAL